MEVRAGTEAKVVATEVEGMEEVTEGEGMEEEEEVVTERVEVEKVVLLAVPRLATFHQHCYTD